MPLHEAGIPIPTPRDPANAPRTPFSFQRFLLPELGGFARRAIYLDSDMLALGDVAELAEIPLEGADFVVAEATPGFDPSHSLIVTSARCPWKIGDIVARLDRGELDYEALMFGFQGLGRFEARLSYHWNSLERYEEGLTRVLHYTAMSHQPWLRRTNPLAPIWIETLLEAIDAGAISPDQVADSVARGWVRPSLLWQVRRGEPDPQRVPAWVGWRDRAFLKACRARRWSIE